jgi:hypothetical protein
MAAGMGSTRLQRNCPGRYGPYNRSHLAIRKPEPIQIFQTERFARKSKIEMHRQSPLRSTTQKRGTTENPNHADAIGWPAEKPAQKIKAMEIAANSRFVAAPT